MAEIPQQLLYLDGKWLIIADNVSYLRLTGDLNNSVRGNLSAFAISMGMSGLVSLVWASILPYCLCPPAHMTENYELPL